MWVEFFQSFGAGGCELVGSFALGGEPAAEGEPGFGIMVVDGGCEVSVDGGVGGCVGEAAVPGLLAGVPDDAELFEGVGAGGVEGVLVVEVALPGEPAP